ncbi:hypothetical protein TRAPUB_7982 [Trametes pubescens]|uniref:Uncharacterized protein n=1 Tax=Trametes pubescens TaxID=154538 RepID=A0A1M2V1Y1_TRAPU|nr:hypothetical protein TRAPUB_7982 [Trametes pubescens]
MADEEASDIVDEAGQESDEDPWGGSRYDSEDVLMSSGEESDSSEVECAYGMQLALEDDNVQFHAGRMEHSATVRRKEDTAESIQPR